jgi:hypothetical protein
MSQLAPCPSCKRHVRVNESSCPFCKSELDLASLPTPVLPRTRLGRAATFAFGATLVGASALASCGDDDGDTQRRGEGGSAGSEANGGSDDDGVGGATAGQGGRAGSSGSAGAGGKSGDGGPVPVYGGPPG